MIFSGKPATAPVIDDSAVRNYARLDDQGISDYIFGLLSVRECIGVRPTGTGACSDEAGAFLMQLPY